MLAEDATNRHLKNQLQRLYLAKISTVHGFCTDILRENAYKLSIPADFRVAEEDECAVLQQLVIERILEEAYEHIGEDRDFQMVVDTQGFGRDDRKIPEVILSIYQRARCHPNPDEWLDKCVCASEITNVTDASQTIWGDYLIKDLHAFLDLSIPAMNRCSLEASASEGMEKAAALLAATTEQMAQLRSCGTWEEIHRNLISDFGRINFGKNPDKELKERIQAVREKCKEELQKKQIVFEYDNEQVISQLRSCAPVVRGLVALVRKFAAEYDLRKQNKRILDFSDLEHRALDLLWGKYRTSITVTANEIGRRFREVMVDEYQDSNEVQDAIFKALTEKRQNCFMVGDVKQSIYQFRLADPGIFLEKYKTYLPADSAQDGQGRKVLLSKNFRSLGNVISGVNDVFEVCMSPAVGGLYYGEEERLNGADDLPILPNSAVEFVAIDVKEDTYAEEAAFVAKRIRQLLDEGALVRGDDGLRQVVPEDIAIILRSPGSVGAQFAAALEAEGVSCSYGNEQNVLQSEEIQFFRSLLQVIDNPLQDIPLVAVMMSRAFGFTADEMASVRRENTGLPIYTLLRQSDHPKVVAFCETINQLRSFARLSTVSELIENILFLTRMDSVLFALNGNTDGIEIFQQIVSQAEQMGHRNVRSFLTYLDSLMERGLSTAQNNRTRGMVTILSIHKSKGLEYPVVFLSGLSKGFNREDLKEQVLCDRELGLGVTCVDGEKRVRYPTIAKRAIALKKASDSLSEELRVLYVAMTRAKDRLIMTYANQHLETAIQKCVRRLDFAGDRLLSREASSMGDWVLQTALHKVEAGQLFAFGDRPMALTTNKSAWRISVVGDICTSCSATAFFEELPIQKVDGENQKYKEALSYVYPYEKATLFPSKQTATQLKGRQKDFEVVENTPMEKKYRPWRKPAFVQKTQDALAAGTATHKALQFGNFRCGFTLEELEAELSKLHASGRLTDEEILLVDREGICHFLHSPLGEQYCTAREILKEFKFSILVDADRFEQGLTGDQVLLQGVVDCAIFDDDGITIIDFKTDAVTESTVSAVAEDYKMQIRAYAEALSRIYEQPIKRSVLYFLRLREAVDVE